MAEEEVFEGLLATLTTERGKEDLVREVIERDEGTRVNSVKGTSTGYLVLAEPKPGGGSGSGGGSGGKEYEPTPDERLYWTDIHDAYEGLDIPVDQLGETPERRIIGKDLIRDSGKSPKYLAGIEVNLECFHSSNLFHTRTEKYGEWWEGYCDKDLRTNLNDFVTEKGVKDGLQIISGYRRLGTHVRPVYKDGKKVSNGDSSGHKDASVEHGHWEGKSVDLVSVSYTKTLIKESFGGSAKVFEKALHEHYLCRRYCEGNKEINHITVYVPGDCPFFK